MNLRSAVLVLAGFVTAAFVAGAGMVAVWPSLDGPRRPVPQVAQPQAPRGFFNFVDVANEPAPIAQPVPITDLPAIRGAAVKTAEYSISGPHTHGNLTVFLIHGAETMKNTNILTLQEAIEQNVAVVHETGMGNLFIDNRGNAPLFWEETRSGVCPLSV